MSDATKTCEVCHGAGFRADKLPCCASCGGTGRQVMPTVELLDSLYDFLAENKYKTESLIDAAQRLVFDYVAIRCGTKKEIASALHLQGPNEEARRSQVNRLLRKYQPGG